MRYLLTRVVALVLALGGLSCNAQPAGPAVDRTSDAKAFVNEVTNRDFARAINRFDATMRGALPEEKLRAVWDGLIAQAGAFKKQGATRTDRIGGYDVVFVACEFERAKLDAKVVFDPDGKIGGLFFVPSAQPSDDAPASYVSRDAFEESDFTFGSEPWVLPGTLSVPKGDGPFPAVVLVHGSGPQDRDETIGANKPFRDLASGLASRNIAVLRYEKRTLRYASKLNPLPLPFTVNEETVDDAVAAVESLRTTPRIDPKRIFVLGHSLGGMLVPRIAARSSNAAGFIILAGTTRPLDDVILEQTNYLALLDGQKSTDDQKQIEAVQTEINRIKKLTEADASDPALVFGAPASYWLDLRNYDPVDTAKNLERPLLILQGERDYQVTMTDFARWRAALDERPNVTLKTYPGLNHLFEDGKGPSAPAEYTIPGHVAQQIVEDVAAWVKR